MQQYEDCAVEYLSENNKNSRVITHSNQEHFRENLQITTSSFKNPFYEAALWIRGEMLDIQGMINAIKGREAVIKRLADTEQKKRDD